MRLIGKNQEYTCPVFDPSNVINAYTVPEDQCTRDNQQAAIDMKSRNSHNRF